MTTSNHRSLKDVLIQILRDHADQMTRTLAPYEGGERQFRKLLIEHFLEDALGWPQSAVVQGERFDILCYDDLQKPVATIETKTPGARLSVEDFESFEDRLKYYPTIETAYITDGQTWDRVDLRAPNGKQEVVGRHGRSLSYPDENQSRLFVEIPGERRKIVSGKPGLSIDAEVGEEELRRFFEPLRAEQYFAEARETRNRIRATSDSAELLEELAGELRNLVREMSDFCVRLFDGYRQDQAGSATGGVARSIFDRWCEQTYIVPVMTACERLQTEFQTGQVRASEIIRVLTQLGLPREASAKTADKLAVSRGGLKTETVLVHIWDVYRAAVEKLAAQTAHVVIARALLYRIVEDKGLFERRISGLELGKALKRRGRPGVSDYPAQQLLGDVRRMMESWLPSVYRLGEFDWWLMTEDKRAALSDQARAWLLPREQEYDRILQRVLRVLDVYWFADIDVDVWRNVYQHYLPYEERQRLGGFYTSDELINIVLDQCEWTAERENLCRCTFIDPASGSGAFVVSALGRLFDHLARDLPCHKELSSRSLAEWQKAESKLRIAQQAMHAVDIHPFAAFLTTINVTFLLIDLYKRVRDANPSFGLDLNVFVADSLEPPVEGRADPVLFQTLNSRIQLTEDALRRYQNISEKKFDFVFGNPPWGGILKGPLAPIFDEERKRRLKARYKDTVSGKYDIYGLFLDRALELLLPDGRVGFVTQGSFIDKEWAGPSYRTIKGKRVLVARGLRRRLAEDSSVVALIDLNPFGQLFFKGMNIPAIIVTENGAPERGSFPVVMSSAPRDFKGLSEAERRARVKNTVEDALHRIATSGKKRAHVSFAQAFHFSRAKLKDFKGKRWVLVPEASEQVGDASWPRAIDLLHPFQGVTPGGEGGLNVFQMSAAEAKRLGLERELVHPVLKGRETTRWRVPDIETVMLYPYRVDGGFRHAFTYGRGKSLKDALEFETPLDDDERAILRRFKGLSAAALNELLQHRIGLGIVRFPHAARYLIGHYEFLSNRAFEKKNIREWGKQWYEYHRPRDPASLLSAPKLITPRLAKGVRFALDEGGILPQDSCACLLPTDKTKSKFDAFRDAATEKMGRTVTELDVLKWCLAFLNSGYANDLLVGGQRPTPKGSFAVTDKFFAETRIPPIPNKTTAKHILTLVDALIECTDDNRQESLERELGEAVVKVLQK